MISLAVKMTDSAAKKPGRADHVGRVDRVSRGTRRASRSLAVQGIYQWLLAHEDAGAIDAFIREQEDYARCDQPYFNVLLHGAIGNAESLRTQFTPQLDRPLVELSPVEHAILLLATQEFLHAPEVPYRVIINEAIELGKSFGGTDGHKYINGVLDKLAASLRPHG
jgi:transcription antitermination protein NusB